MRVGEVLRLATNESNSDPAIRSSNIHALCVHLQGALKFHSRLKKVCVLKYMWLLISKNSNLTLESISEKSNSAQGVPLLESQILFLLRCHDLYYKQVRISRQRPCPDVLSQSISCAESVRIFWLLCMARSLVRQ
jgi:hypothetical protein